MAMSDEVETDHPKCLHNLRWYFMEYCNNTSIHGFKYLGERRSSTEKIWWIIVLTCSLYFCTAQIKKTYEKWERSPVIVSFATSETPIWEIPFPAVTICPRTKAIKSRYNFTEMALLKNNSTRMNSRFTDKITEFEYMSLVCVSKLNLFFDEQAKPRIQPGIFNFLLEVQPEFSETIYDATWVGQNFATDDVYSFFKPIITSDGACYSFNMVDRNEIFTEEMTTEHYTTFPHEPKSQWTVEKGYDKNAGLNAFPRRTMVSGVQGGLDLILLTWESDLDYVCGDALQGYKIVVHHPAMLPNPKQNYIRIGLNQDVVVSLKPNMMTTSSSLKRYPYQDRICYLADEKFLRFFKLYNQQDCLLECLTNFTYQLCHCVAFYMPRDNSTPICGPANHRCMNLAQSEFLSNEVSFKIEHPDRKALKNSSEESIHEGCNCLPSCDKLSFDAEVSLSNWDWQRGWKTVAPKNKSERYHLSRLKIFFKEMQFITSQRNELYGSTDFLANCGGLLGLFTGFSFISLVEVVYFATLRFACNFRKHGRHRWSGAQELLKKWHHEHH